MNNRNDEGGRGHPQGPRQGQREYPRQARGQYDFDDRSDRNRMYQHTGRDRGEYYGSRQFEERAQGAAWDDDRSNWEYEGGPERYSTSGYGETDQQGYRQQQRAGRLYGTNYREEPASDYYSGREGYGARSAFGSEYNTYGRSQGYGEGSGYTRSTQPGSRQFTGSRGHAESSRYGGESAGYGGRAALHASQDYTDEGEMSGYVGRELDTQLYGASPGRYGTAPGQYGYGGLRATGRRFRGVGPKNYTRSDERLAEEINERLTDDDDLDASGITVRVSAGKVTLEGNVDQRWMKHRAEDIADSCLGIKEVDNRIQVAAGSSILGQETTGARGARTSASAATGTTTGTPGTTGTH